MSFSSPDFDYRFKVLTLGNSGVGKTNILLRFTEDKFQQSFITTIGVDFKMKTISVGGERARLHVWDSAGQERFRCITPAYYRNAHAIILVYDVSDPASFDQLQGWMNSIQAHCKHPVQMVLAANKCDLDDEERAISTEQGQKVAERCGMKYWEVSAKTGANIQAMFNTLTADCIRSHLEYSTETPDQLDMAPGRPLASESSCCK